MSDSHLVPSAEAMITLGGDFASSAKSGDVFGLIGTLGTGKTHWSKGFVEALDADADVTSPTFGIVNEYTGGSFPVFHFDFYRLKLEQELIALGWDEYLDQPGIVICEWADRFPHLMPPHTKWLRIEHACDNSRLATVLEQSPAALTEDPQ